MTIPASQGDNLVFLISLPRSGSTLLQRILGSHSCIHTTAEPWLMLLPNYALRSTGFDAEYDANLARQGLEDFLDGLGPDGRAAHDEAIRAYANTLYGRALTRSGKSMFLDKTPRYWYVLDDLRRIYPNARFIYLLRNPLAIVASVLNTWFAGDIDALAASSHARDLNDGPASIAAAMQRLGPLEHVLRYEDLVTEPAQTMAGLCAFLDLDFEPSMLDYGNYPAPAGRHGDNTSIHRHERPVSEYRDTWHRHLSSARGRRFAFEYLEKLGKETLEIWGYDAQTMMTHLVDAPESARLPDQADICADRLNAQGEKLFGEGRITEATQVFQQVIDCYPEFITAYNNLAVANWQMNDLAGAVDALRRGLELDLLDRDLVLNAVTILSALGAEGDARLLCERYLASKPGDEAVLSELGKIAASAAVTETNAADTESEHLIPNEQSAVSEPRVVIGTSIAPFGIAKQQRAVRSWVDLGFDVISLNIQQEIDQLAPLFPGVRFVVAKRDGRRAGGKPLVYLDDLLSILSTTSAETVGIVNSDIVLRCEKGIRRFLRTKATGSLVYGSRVDVDDFDTDKGSVYHRGYDLFFLDRRLIPEVPASEFMLGAPWWDYWMPAALLMSGRPVKRLDARIAFHKRHPANYSTELLQQLGDRFAALCADEPFVDLFRQCIALQAGDVCYSVLADAALDYLSRSSERAVFSESSEPAEPGPGETGSRSPRITAIVSTYNSEFFIGDCLTDLSHQTVSQDIEIIVIDAASEQNERAIVQRFQAENPQCLIRYLRLKERVSVYSAWNIAVRMAQGDFIISCSTNDRLRLDACEILARTLDEQPTISLVYGNSYLTRVPHQSFDAPTVASLYVWPEYTYQLLTERCLVGPHPMWRRSVHDDVGHFDESLVTVGDQEFWLRLGQSHRMLTIPDFTGLYFVSEDSVTGDIDTAQVETDRVQTYYRSKFRFKEWSSRRRRWVRLSEEKAGTTVALVVRCQQEEFPLLADTLDSLARIPGAGWHLTVLSPAACPDPAFLSEPQLDWCQYEDEADYLVQRERVIHNSGMDWLGMIDPGDRLAASLLHDLSGYANAHAECRFVYTDEDAEGDADKSITLRLKPDWNAELQRSTSYVGKLCLVHRTALQVIGGIGSYLYAMNDDVLWRIWARFGDASIGHLSEVLLTSFPSRMTMELSSRCASEQRSVLKENFERLNSHAVVGEGGISGTRDIQYRVPREPKVSVLVLAETNSDNLARCVASVFDNTTYIDFEILVGVQDRFTDQLSQMISTSLGSRDGIRVVSVPDGAAVGQQLNCLAEQAEGETLLFLRDQMIVLQKTWMRNMVGYCLQPGVGLVGVRVLNQRRGLVHAGIVLGLGLNAVGARVNEGMHLSSPGYMNFNQVAREVGAVSSLCMMTTAEQFSAVGGFSAELGIRLYRDVDFAQRIRANGRKIVWTPQVTLMFSGEQSEVDGGARSLEQVQDEADYIHRHWLKMLARDPGYHLQLGLRNQLFGQEMDFPCGWNPEVDRNLKVVAAGTGSNGSWYYRGQQPVERLAKDGLIHATLVRFPRGKDTLPVPSVVDLTRMKADVFLMHNTLHDVHLEALQKYKRHTDVFVVFGQDDLMFELPKSNPFAKTVFKDMKKRLRRCLALADRLVVTTEPLADALRDWNDDVRIVPNYLDESIWGHLAPACSQGQRPRVGWAGASQHAGDLQLLEEVLKQTADEVDWIFLGMCPPSLRRYVREFHTGVALDRYPEKLASLNLDLAVAPLEYNRFNEAKSNLRLLEYGVLGWPVIATDIAPYQGAPVSLVRNHPKAWVDAVYDHIHEPAAARAVGGRLQAWVKQNWMLQSHLGEWLNVLSPDINAAGRNTATPRATDRRESV